MIKPNRIGLYFDQLP